MTGPRPSASGRAPLVYVVDDDPSFLKAITRRLEAEGFEVKPFASAAAFLAIRHQNRPSCAVIDVRMPELDGIALQRAVASGPDPIPLIFLTGHGDVETSVEAMKRGAVDFLLKPVPGELLTAAIDAAIARDREWRNARVKQADAHTRFARLTPREREVCALLVQGLLNKQIAFDLGMSERTVKAHRAQIMQKTGCASLADLVRLWETIQADADVPEKRAS